MGQETIFIRQILAQVYSENLTLKKQLSTLSHIHFSERARLGILTHFCLSRIHQILTSIIPYVPMSPGEHNEVSQLKYEFLRAAQQLKPPAADDSFV